MNKIKLLVLNGVLISGLAFGNQNDSWQVQSTEKQFDTAIGVFVKNSSANQNLQQQETALNQLGQTTSSKQAGAAKLLNTRTQARGLDQEFWIFDAWVEFRRDNDGDGFYNHFSVEFDADTEYSSALVYARLYLGDDEVFKEYHTTSDFSIYADSSNDSFVVDSELLSGFPSDDYEVLIELYDAYSNELVATLDGNNDADLFLLPLESLEYEAAQVVVVREHGGSLGWWAILLLPFILCRQKLKGCRQ